MFLYYSIILKKKSIQFLFKDLQQSYKKIHIIISFINLKKFRCLEIKIALQYYIDKITKNLIFFQLRIF